MTPQEAERVLDHHFDLEYPKFCHASEAWQTLKAAVLAQQPNNTGMAGEIPPQICQMIVEDQLNHLVREKLLTRPQCMQVRDMFVAIIAGKLRHA